MAEILDDLAAVHALRSARTEIESIAQREVKQAESLFKRALQIREKPPKPDDSEIAKSLFNLGQLAFGLDRMKDGVPYFQRWLELQQKNNKPESEQQANVLGWLAEAAIARRDLDEAERLLAKAAGVFGRVKGPESKEVMDVLSMRLDAALEAGRFDDAERFIKRSLELQSKKLGADDPVIAAARPLLATSYKDHVRDRRAPVLWSRLDALWERHMGLESARLGRRDSSRVCETPPSDQRGPSSTHRGRSRVPEGTRIHCAGVSPLDCCDDNQPGTARGRHERRSAIPPRPAL